MKFVLEVAVQHGHTVFHGPPGAVRGAPSTWQIGEPAVIAAHTGVTTVADFRPADVAHGGQGYVAEGFANGPRLATASIKRCVNEGLRLPLADGLALERDLIEKLFDSKDGVEGLAAFAEKRKPTFTGS